MKPLHDILYKVKLRQIVGAADTPIEHITFDSRQVRKGSLFIAIKGAQADGHDFIRQAIDQGASAIVCEKTPADLSVPTTCPIIIVPDTSEALAVIAGNFFNNPSEKIQLMGVTGTNGKTTVATLSYQLFRRLGFRCGLISTIHNEIDGYKLPATLTTPDAVQINTLLSQMVEAGCTHCFMEASSHAIYQNRVYGLDFNMAVFTNITHDHLDYHKTFDKYINAKKKLFDEIPAHAYALVNIDDKRGRVMVQNTKAIVKTYSLKSVSDFKAIVLENSFGGLVLQIDGHELHSSLVGEFNAYNLLAVYAIAVLWGIAPIKALTALSTLSAPEGRFDYFITPGKKIVGIVDYAHTPDALKNVLATIRSVRTHNENLITVVGCGGNRDVSKRPDMARIACHYSNRVILTSDNPRYENPQDIIKDMQKGVAPEHQKKVLTIIDRKEAIRTACALAGPHDIILLAGKGHEKYQEIQGVKYEFDDKKILEHTLADMDK